MRREVKEFHNSIDTNNGFFTEVKTKMVFDDDTSKERSVSMPEPEFRRCVEAYFKCPSLEKFVGNAGVVLKASSGNQKPKKYDYSIETDRGKHLKISKKHLDNSGRVAWLGMPEKVFAELVQEYYDCPDLTPPKVDKN